MKYTKIYDSTIKQTRFNDIQALEAYRWNLILRYKALQSEWDSIFAYLNSLNNKYLLGSYNNKLYLFENHGDGVSYELVENYPPIPHPNASSKDILLTKAEDLPLYVNINLSNICAKNILEKRLKEDISDITINNEIVFKYFKISNRINKLFRIIHVINEILLYYVDSTYVYMAFHNNKGFNNYFFKLSLNNRDYYIQFNQRKFTWVHLPEDNMIQVPVPKDISNLFQFYSNPY